MAIDAKKYTVCLGALYALNGLLPPEYRVEIDDDLYREKTRTDVFMVCGNPDCAQEIDRNTIVVKREKASPVIMLITKREHQRVWMCPKCNFKNVFDRTRMIKTTLKMPYFLKVVPQPPSRQDGILDRKSFIKKFDAWAWTLLDELEERMAQYRDDNWERGGEMDTGPEIDTNLEDEVIA